MDRKKLLLTILLLLLLCAVIYAVLRSPRQQRVAAVRSGAAAVSPAAKAAVPESTLRLDLLQKQRAPFTGFRKNIFRPVFQERSKGGETKVPAPVRPIPIPLPPPAPPAPVRPVPPPPPPVAAQPEPPPVQREMAQFTFLGFMVKDRRKSIFLSKDKEIFVVKKGDRIAGKYEAANITDEALTIRVLDSGTEIMIPLIENRPLTSRPR